jgi:GNAT superfamily N-acetyltransferase
VITPISKTNSSVLHTVSQFIFENRANLNDALPECGDLREVAEALQGSQAQWSILQTNRPLALFNLQTTDTRVELERFCLLDQSSLREAVTALLGDLAGTKFRSLTMNVQEELVDPLASLGFKSGGGLLRFSRQITETVLMPILPLTNLDQRDLSTLAELMLTSYDTSTNREFNDTTSAEKYLQDIMAGWRGDFIDEASFISSTPGTRNVVSACLVTSPIPKEATIVELFTHPLYRARGLATTEIASAMNRLAKRGFHTVTAWLPEGHEIMYRLLMKLGLKQDRKLIHVMREIP